MPWFSRASDRRTARRFQAEIPVVLSVVGDQEIASLHALADGISQDGLSVAALQGLEIGQPVSLEIRLPNSTQPIWAEATVRHNHGRCGLQFVSLAEPLKKLIQRYCRLQPPEKRRPA